MRTACVCNPYGWDAFILPVRLFLRIEPVARSVFSANISENVPLLDLAQTQPSLVLLVTGLALAVLALFALQLHVFRLTHLAIFTLFLYLGFTAERNAFLFVVVGGALAVHYASAAIQTSREGNVTRVLTAAAWVCVVGALTVQTTQAAQVVRNYPVGTAVSPFRFPQSAVRYLKAHPVEGRMFNSDRYGGYLLWHLYPPVQVYMDGRFVLRTAEFFSEYLAAFDRPETFEGLRNRYSITTVLVQTAIFDRYLPLAGHLYRDPKWRLVDTDGASALFVVDSLASTPPIDLSDSAAVRNVRGTIDRQWSANPALRREARAHFEHMRVRLIE